MEFQLVHMYNEFNRKHFDVSKVWASYYEPDDIDEIVKMGYKREEVVSKLKEVGWSDDYCFPVADQTVINSFMLEYRKAIFKTLTGKTFDGYIVNEGYAITLFGGLKEWSINIQLLDMLQKQTEEITGDLQINSIEELFPLNVSVPVINYEFIFAENS